jgi:hypothetical protein
MDQDRIIRKLLLELLAGGSAHMGFDGAVAEFPPEYMNRRPPNVPYTFWHLLEHMRIAQWDILEFIRKPDHVSPDWPDKYWPQKNKRAGKTEWEKTVKNFRADLKSVQRIVRDPKTEFFSPIPHARDYTIFREVLLVADHNAYHIGEFIILRQVMNIPPPDRW